VTETDEPMIDAPAPRSSKPSRGRALIAPLAGALVCTALIAEAVITALRAGGNGDMMVVVCPILGAIFFSIPACQAWAKCWSILRGRA